jgi:hypothetical protein
MRHIELLRGLKMGINVSSASVTDTARTPIAAHQISSIFQATAGPVPIDEPGFRRGVDCPPGRLALV